MFLKGLKSTGNKIEDKINDKTGGRYKQYENRYNRIKDIPDIYGVSLKSLLADIFAIQEKFTIRSLCGFVLDKLVDGRNKSMNDLVNDYYSFINFHIEREKLLILLSDLVIRIVNEFNNTFPSMNLSIMKYLQVTIPFFRKKDINRFDQTRADIKREKQCFQDIFVDLTIEAPQGVTVRRPVPSPPPEETDPTTTETIEPIDYQLLDKLIEEDAAERSPGKIINQFQIIQKITNEPMLVVPPIPDKDVTFPAAVYEDFGATVTRILELLKHITPIVRSVNNTLSETLNVFSYDFSKMVINFVRKYMDLNHVDFMNPKYQQLLHIIQLRLDALTRTLDSEEQKVNETRSRIYYLDTSRFIKNEINQMMHHRYHKGNFFTVLDKLIYKQLYTSQLFNLDLHSMETYIEANRDFLPK